MELSSIVKVIVSTTVPETATWSSASIFTTRSPVSAPEPTERVIVFEPAVVGFAYWEFEEPPVAFSPILTQICEPAAIIAEAPPDVKV